MSFDKLNVCGAGDAVRQDGVPVGLHGAGHPPAQRPAVDPRRRVHRQVLHRVRRREQAPRFRAGRLGRSLHPPPLSLHALCRYKYSL